MIRIFGLEIARPARPAVDPSQPVSGYLVGETHTDRLERIYADAAELLRRAYADLPWSRRAMRDLQIGPRRWQSAYSMLQHASLIRPDGTRVIDDPVMARRMLAQCREHYAYAMRQGRYALPF